MKIRSVPGWVDGGEDEIGWDVGEDQSLYLITVRSRIKPCGWGLEFGVGAESQIEEVPFDDRKGRRKVTMGLDCWCPRLALYNENVIIQDYVDYLHW